jgi:hypothetical protein
MRQRLHEIRLERIAERRRLFQKPSVILHSVPLSSQQETIDLVAVSSRPDFIPTITQLRALSSSVSKHRYNFDGIRLYSPDDPSIHVQIYRNGSIEQVTSEIRHSIHDTFRGTVKNLPHDTFEDSVISGLSSALSFQKYIGVTPPIVIMLSLVNYLDYSIYAPFLSDPIARWGLPIEHEVLETPDIVVNDYEGDPAKILRPVFDVVWNAAGHWRSLNYNDAGERVPRGE